MGTVQYDVVCWAPKEYTPGEDIDTSGQQASHYSGAPGRKKGARGKASEETTSEGEAGRAPQSGFVWDEASGYYYDAASGFYYDGHRGNISCLLEVVSSYSFKEDFEKNCNYMWWLLVLMIV
jgi:RNA-binding protein 5/10